MADILPTVRGRNELSMDEINLHLGSKLVKLELELVSAHFRMAELEQFTRDLISKLAVYEPQIVGAAVAETPSEQIAELLTINKEPK